MADARRLCQMAMALSTGVANMMCICACARGGFGEFNMDFRVYVVLDWCRGFIEIGGVC